MYLKIVEKGNCRPRNRVGSPSRKALWRRVHRLGLCLLLGLGWAQCGVALPAVSTGSDAPEVQVGQWRTHLPLGKVTCVLKVGDIVYAGCSGGLFTYDLRDGTVERKTKVNGLHDVEVAALGYEASYQTLIVGYANGNLDLYRDGKFVALDAVLKANVPTGKKIRSMYLAGRYAYLCYGFGIVELDLLKSEIRSTFVIGPQGTYLGVHALVDFGGKWVAATDSGLYAAPKDAPNLQSFEFWERDAYWQKQPFYGLAVFRDSLVTYKGDSLVWYREGGHRSMQVNEGAPNTFIGVSGGCLNLVNTLRAVRFDSLLQAYNYPIVPEAKQPSSVVYDGYQMWMGDMGGGLFRFTPWETYRYVPDGPPTDKVFQLKANANGVALAGGAYNSVYDNTFDPSGAAWLEGNRWRPMNRDVLRGVGNLYDAISALPDPYRSDRLWISTWGRGVFQVNGDSAVAYDAGNSALQVQQGTNSVVRVSGLFMDKSGDLWMSNFGASKPVVVRRANGAWESFATGPQTELLDMLVDQAGNKWMRNRGGGLVVMDPNNTRYVAVNSGTGTGGLPSNQVLSMAEDRDGAVWIGTTEGPVVFYNPTSVFRSTFNAARLKIQQEQFVGYLLGTEVIQAMTVDGANRKWFGTTNGLWLFNPECTRLLAHFTVENTPLLSNNIVALAVDPVAGEVLVGTDKGLMGYRSTATQGVGIQGEVEVFPNPVPPDFEGYLSVRGLVTDAWIKVTDAQGQLVYQTKADGGQVSWNLRDPSGQRVRSGLYLIHSVAFDSYDLSSQTVVAKAVVVSRPE
jgi:ligand-binding sensor domain-containing protein